MIGRLKGVLLEKSTDRILLDVHDVGYEVQIPISTYYELKDIGSTVSLHIYTHVKEDSLSLYGFATAQEKTFFKRLIQISGIGPKLGVTILSGLSVEDLVQAVSVGDAARLHSIPGVGKKTAERIVLELKDKIASLFPEVGASAGAALAGSSQADLISALMNLGYPRAAAEKAASSASREAQTERFEVLLRAALKKLSGPAPKAASRR